MRGEIVLTRRSLLALIACIWLIGGLAVLAVGYFYYQSKSDAINYVINRGSCQAYTLIDPAIKANDTLLLALDRSIKDPATSTAMLTINKKRRVTVRKQQAGLKSFRKVYGTIPRDYDCRRLPKQPPS